VKALTPAEEFYQNRNFRIAMKSNWNDGYQSAVANAEMALFITEEQGEDLLTELAELEDYNEEEK